MNTDLNKVYQLLLVEDNPGDARLIHEYLLNSYSARFELTPATRLSEAIEITQKKTFDVMLLDLTLPDASGLDTIRKAHDQFPLLPILVMSGIDDEPLSLQAVAAGAQDYVLKGDISPTSLIRALLYAIERQRLQVELDTMSKQQQHLATHDRLTGLPNRQLLQDRLEQVLRRSVRYNYNFAVLFLDIDGFKAINDTLGHSQGDELLIEISKRLKLSVRETDTVSRLGGDEFVLILTRLPEPQFAAQISQKILDLLAKPIILLNQEMFIHGSLGIAIFPDDGSDEDTLLKNADTAMYSAKESGKNTYRFYTKGMNAATQKQLTLTNKLSRAIENDELLLNYQPQMDVQNNKIIGIEALARWKHPELGFIPPSDFIPLAEDSGLIVLMGQWILRTAAEQFMHWLNTGIAPQYIAVNLSARQFEQPDFAKSVFEILDSINMQPAHLELELTESIIMKDAQETIDTLQKLKDKGILISIDDFGTGYSSLSYLKRMPIDTLKIDQSFVQDISKDDDNARIVMAIIALANSLGLNVLAEGVETAEQSTFLMAHGCPRMQGYFFSKPMTANDCTAYLKKNGG